MWEVRNRNRFPHNFHVHEVQFRLLSIDGSAPPPELAGRKDTIYLEPGQEAGQPSSGSHADHSN